MRHFNHVRVRRVLVVLVLLTLTTTARIATAQDRTVEAAVRLDGMPADVRAAHEWLFGLYPDLLQRDIQLTLTPTDDAWLVEIADAPTPGTAPTSRPDPLLTATVAFDGAGQLAWFSARGLLVEQVRNDVLLDQMRAHPEWAESDAEVWLTTAGGRPTIGQSAPPVAALGAQSWSRFLGSSVTTTASRFRWREEDAATSGRRVAPPTLMQPPEDGPRGRAAVPLPPGPPPPRPAVRPSWVVEATAVAADGTPVRYRLEYEPFAGRLIAAVRQ